jgi:hypothetical protein
MHVTRRLAPALLALFLLACSDDDSQEEEQDLYLNGNTPSILLQNLQRAWIHRDIEYYETLFSDDYRFYFAPSAIEQDPQLPEYWTRAEEVESVGQLFASENISDIRLSVMEYDPVPEPVNEPGLGHWLLIKMTDEKLEIEQRPLPGQNEGITLLVDGQPQHFYFRKGKTEADTLASSPTSAKYYIVRWEDLGQGSSDFLGVRTATMPTTWGSIKSAYK